MIAGTLALAVGLGMDVMSVCLGVGVRWNGWRQRFRMAWHMGLFQFLMPVTGWLIGKPLAQHIVGWGRYAAAALVFAVGAKMLVEVLKKRGQRGTGILPVGGMGVPPMRLEGFQPSRDGETDSSSSMVQANGTVNMGGTPIPRDARDPTRGWSLVMLSIATSLDALVVGFSLELRSPGVSIWWPSVIIGIVAATMALTGIAVGKFMGEKLGKWAELLGAVVLMAIGVSFVVWR